jgi:hypothetical protein
MGVDLLKESDDGNICEHFSPAPGTVNICRNCSDCDNVWCYASSHGSRGERRDVPGGIGSYFHSGSTKMSNQLMIHNPEQCPNSARTDMLIEQFNRMERKMDNLVNKHDFTSAFNSMRSTNEKLVMDVAENTQAVEELQTAFRTGKTFLAVIQWSVAIIGSIGVAWAVLTGKITAP